MNLSSHYPVSTFGHIYYRALQLQLKKIGSNLVDFRKAQCKDVQTVAEAVNIRTEVLLKIESGQHNVRIRTLHALCDYFGVDIDSIVNQGELLSFKLS